MKKVDLGWMRNPDDYVECEWCHGRGTIWSTYPDVREHLCHVCVGSGAVKKVVETQESITPQETASAHWDNGISMEKKDE